MIRITTWADLGYRAETMADLIKQNELNAKLPFKCGDDTAVWAKDTGSYTPVTSHAPAKAKRRELSKRKQGGRKVKKH